MHDRDHRLGRLVGGQPLDHGGQDALGLDLGVVLRGPFDLAGGDRGRAFRVGLDALDELGARVLGGQPRDALEDAGALGLQVEQLDAARLHPALALVELPGALLQVTALGVQPFLTLGESVLTSLDVQPLLLQVLMQVVGAPVRSVPPEQHHRQRTREHRDHQQQHQHDLEEPETCHERVRACCLTPRCCPSVHARLLSLWTRGTTARQPGRFPAPRNGSASGTPKATTLRPPRRLVVLRVCPAFTGSHVYSVLHSIGSSRGGPPNGCRCCEARSPGAAGQGR